MAWHQGPGWQNDLSNAGPSINAHTPDKLGKVDVIEWKGDPTIDEIQQKYGEYIRMRRDLLKVNATLAQHAGWKPIQSAFEFIFGIAQGINEYVDKKDGGGSAGRRELVISNLEITIKEKEEALLHFQSIKDQNELFIRRDREQKETIASLTRDLQVSLLLSSSRLL